MALFQNTKHVFLSHYQVSGGDQCLLLRDVLMARGLSVWYDQDCAPTRAGIIEGVAGAGVVLSFLSRDVLTRPFVHLELQTALTYNKPILFVHEHDLVWGQPPPRNRGARRGVH